MQLSSGPFEDLVDRAEAIGLDHNRRHNLISAGELEVPLVDQLKSGDRVMVETVVQEVRSDGVVVLAVPASTSIIPAVILSTADRLAARQPAPADSASLSESAATTGLAIPPSASASFSIGAAVTNAKGDSGVVIEPVDGVYKIRRLQGRSDCVMVQWRGRSLPTWEAPDEIRPA